MVQQVSIVLLALAGSVAFAKSINQATVHVSAQVTLVTSNPVVGSSVQIDCKAEGPKNLDVGWQFSQSQLANDKRRRILSNHTLIIAKASSYDTGVYQCIAQSHNSMASASVYVNIRRSIREPIPDSPANDAAMENPDLFEGDILGFEIDDDRNAVVEKYRVWPNGRIPYIIDPKLKLQVPKIEAAMHHYAEKTCIRFVPRTNEVQYVKIFPGKGCYSHVGKTLNDQPLSLGPGCFKFGTILHELGHAVGFYHEHSRSDRDDYLEIHRENIREGFENQFVKLRPKQNQLLTPFDFDSVMLYGETVFSKSHYDGLKTMTAKDGRTLQDIVDKPGLSESDIKRISKLYKC